jgi:tetratricopeptide (TPR) repeat protein
MSWNDAPLFEARLKRALDSFDWSEAEAICTEVVNRTRVETEVLPELSARRLLHILRRKRRFAAMTSLAEALLQSGVRTPQIRRQYAQALIDQGHFPAAEAMLQTIIHDPQGIKGEELEARGLTGRIYKQLYVNANDPRLPRSRANLERALTAYREAYQRDPDQHLWHGINAVALADRARRDGLPIAGAPDARALAAAILTAFQERERQSTIALPAWDWATAMEAYVALDRHRDAADAALRYVDSVDADAFEIASTTRQLAEVWQLTDREPPGAHLLPILKAGLLARLGSAFDREVTKVAEEAAAVGGALRELEAIFGADRMVTLKWYKQGLEQCSAVARIEKRSGKGHGTGWLVRAGDFFPGREGVLLLTCAHVVSATPNPWAIAPEEARVNFQVRGEVLDVEADVVWSSPPAKLDATLLALKGRPSAQPLCLHKRPAVMTEPAPRMYIIGYPAGRDLELSLQDNHLLAASETLLHYRTPTEPGSSGSPVFEPDDWRVVALHHRGSQEMPRIDGGEGTYQANEGIAIPAIQKATAAS